MRERTPIDRLMAVKVSKSAESKGDVLDAVAGLLISIHEQKQRAKTDEAKNQGQVRVDQVSVPRGVSRRNPRD